MAAIFRQILSGLWGTVLLCFAASALSVRVATWNVAGNKWMSGGFDPEAVIQLLGVGDKHDVIAVTVQANAYKATPHEQQQLAAVFGDVLGRHGKYRLVSASAVPALAPATALLVFARDGVLQPREAFHVGCSGGSPQSSAERGVAGARVVVTATGRSICFAGLHLDSEEAGRRRRCLTEFWREARSRQELGWARCDHVVMAGDFGARVRLPEEMLHEAEGPVMDFVDDNFSSFRFNDEMNGAGCAEPLLDHIREQSGHPLAEAYVTFLPTSALRPLDQCKAALCYRLDPDAVPAWPDRILCSGCTAKRYRSLRLGSSDHDPVVLDLELASVRNEL